MGTVRRGSIVRRITAVTCIMLLLFTFLYVPASAQETTRSRSVNIRVVNADNVPIKGAYVSFWNHSATPSVMVAEAYTDEQGTARFVCPEFADSESDCQHLSVMVTALGYETKSWHWSMDRETDSATGLSMSGPASEEVIVRLEGRHTTSAEGLVQPMDYPGEIRHRLVWWDYDTYRNQPTTVAIINQVGYMESSFTFKTKVETNVDVAVKGVSGGWTPSGSIKVSKLVGNELKWSLAATKDDSKYWRETCKTQYDYRLEEYAVEQYQDNGDTWEWVRIDTQYKFYAHDLNANATPYGEFECTSTPPSGTTWTGNIIGPLGEKVKTSSEMDEIGVAFRGTVIFAEVTLGLKHVSATTSEWRAKNTATQLDGKSYELGNGTYKSWVFRPH
jgi:hypothetical protein